MVQFWVAASSAAWGWQNSQSGATIPKSFGFENATPCETTTNVTRNLTYLNHANFYTIGTLPPPDNASGPNPRDGAANQLRTVTLQWQPGAKAAQHKVWFGTDCGSMTLQATLPRGTETYIKTGLDYLTTYYWAVDEVNEPNTWALPDCWSFMTVVDTNTVIDVNLVGYWKFDGDASDSSGYGNHGTLMGTAALVPGGPVTFGEVLELYDQANSLVNCGNGPFLAIPSMAQNLTVSAWVKSRAGTFNEDSAPFVTKRGEDSLGWQLRKRGGQNTARFTLRGTSAGDDSDGVTNILDNEWHCLVGTYNGVVKRLYVDGNLDATGGDTGNIADAPLDNVAIGAKYRNGDATNPQGWMWGQIDEVRIYNRALSSAEVQKLLERYVAYDPTPGNGAQNAAITTNLSWTAGADVATHKVFFGTDKASLPKVAEPPAGTKTWDPPGDLAYFTKYYWTVTEVNALGTEYITDTWSFRTMADPAIGTGQILREIWQNITPTGTAISLLYNWPDFPNNPTSSDMLTEFATDPSWDQYGGRIHGWLYVPVSGAGDYTFYITSDDNGQLWLSTDEDPANAQLIAQETGSRGLYAWPATGEEVSAPITLAGGKSYYISALWKEGSGGDHCAVGWQGPLTGNEIEVIAGCFLSPFVKVWPNTPSPADKSVDQPRIVTLRWTAGIDEALGAPNTIQRVYIGADAASVAAAGPGSPQDKGLAASPNQFGPITKNFYERVYWKVVETDSASNLYSSPVWSYKVIYDATLVPDPNLVLWYKFDGDALDSSGHGREGTEMNGPTYAPGYDGEAISLDGVDQWVDVQDPVGISGSAPRTIAGWAKARTTAIPDWTTVFGFSPATGAANLYFDIERRGGQNQYCIHVYGFEDNIMPIDLEWHHLAATYDEPTTTISWYGDGVFVDSNNTRVLATIDSVKVGRRGDRQTYFPGMVDDVRIYDYALTEAEIALIMRANLAWAWGPNPINGAIDVSLTPILTWKPGDYAPPANGHYVYFGADDPANMALVITTPPQPQTLTSYTPGALDLDTTYYWAVDEVNTTLGGVDAGRTWSFTTINNKVVDDFETYEDAGELDVNWIYLVYTDGFGDLACTEGTGNGSGAKIALQRPGQPSSSIAMKFEYDNDGMVKTPKPCDELETERPRAHYSKVEALVAKLDSDTGSDWTVRNCKIIK